MEPMTTAEWREYISTMPLEKQPAFVYAVEVLESLGLDEAMLFVLPESTSDLNDTFRPEGRSRFTRPKPCFPRHQKGARMTVGKAENTN